MEIIYIFVNDVKLVKRLLEAEELERSLWEDEDLERI
jgi:hypothetical protein